MNNTFLYTAMEALNWTGPAPRSFVTATLDDELERYRLLAYLQRVDSSYRDHKLYPWLDELVLRVAQLFELRKQAGRIRDHLTGDVVGLDLMRQRLIRQVADTPAYWALVERSIARVLPALQQARERGEELREELSGHIQVESIGLIPLDLHEGWLLLRQHDRALVYAYSLPLVREPAAPQKHRHIRTRYHATWTLDLGTTYEHIKAELVRSGPLPNPATFAFESDISLPRIETFLPLAKQITYELVSAVADAGS